MTCTKRYNDIPFAHRQPNHSGHCRFIHGHNWSFEFEFAAKAYDECGFVMDFGKLQTVKRILQTFDHALVLNQSDPLWKKEEFEAVLNFCGRNLVLVGDCSAEGLARYMFFAVSEVIKHETQGRVSLRRVTVFEDSKNSATYVEEQE